MPDFPRYDTSIPTGLITPASLSVGATTGTELIHLSGSCMSVSRVAVAISQAIEQIGGTLVHSTAETDGLNRRLSIELVLPALSRLEAIRSAIHSAGGIIERLQIEYGIRRPASEPAAANPPQPLNTWYEFRPKPCTGCRYYHGQYYAGNLLVCAIHPYGPDGDSCHDRQDFDF
ncbi:MAG: hypothetical protein KME26_27700 [Oscillatoria princeps RMCB-10]|nr:hypothetical protein [Oscillatoria princeps RMCB-10]